MTTSNELEAMEMTNSLEYFRLSYLSQMPSAYNSQYYQSFPSELEPLEHVNAEVNDASLDSSRGNQRNGDKKSSKQEKKRLAERKYRANKRNLLKTLEDENKRLKNKKLVYEKRLLEMLEAHLMS